jgi:CHAD domain-containing protein
MAAKRTAIRRGLAVRGAAHGPPWGRRKARGHPPILAPRAAASRSPAPARALAVLAVGIGVGLALMRAERERRAAAARERRPRAAALRAEETPSAGMRRVVIEQLDLAIGLLESYRGEAERETTVHEVRKALKRLRALLALQRDLLGSKRFARENAVLRECGARLAGARDAEVMVTTLEDLVRRHPKRLAGKRGVVRLRAELLAERERAAVVRDPEVRRAVVEELRGVRTRMLQWQPRAGRSSRRGLASGLERVYRKGRGRLRRARRDPGVRTLHALRKSAKDLRYVAETLNRGGAGSGVSRSTREEVRGVARRADRLGEVLGEEHDLALLARVVRKRFVGKRRTRRALLKLIARRRRRLRERALRIGGRLYERKPKRFVRRLRGAL